MSLSSDVADEVCARFDRGEISEERRDAALDTIAEAGRELNAAGEAFEAVLARQAAA